MSFYRAQILPYLVHVSMRQGTFAAYRQRLVSAAEGRALEIGVGSGLNFPFYANTTTRLIGLDPSSKLLSMAREGSRRVTFPVELLEGSAEAIPLENNSVDTVVTTWTLCSVLDPTQALGEVRRVLRPSGRLLFVEHRQSPDANVRRWQDRLTPLWKRIGGGCHLNRALGQLIENSGFRIEHMKTGYMKGPKPMTFMYEGWARSR
jgi:ubiquinone/menaquinone biosynthesis C-methylase UbiE